MQSGEGPVTPPALLQNDALTDVATAAAKHVGSKRVEGKKCGVCGDRALGYNFNAITCESCKAFFRRNALKNKEFRCPFKGNCEVTAVTRRFCQRCRLRKCFDVGMKKEWIMTDDEKKKKKKKIEENKLRKIDDVDPTDEFEGDPFDDSSSSSPDDSFPVKPSVSVKPQAVVVGRVRIEEPASKKLKKQCDAGGFVPQDYRPDVAQSVTLKQSDSQFHHFSDISTNSELTKLPEESTTSRSPPVEDDGRETPTRDDEDDVEEQTVGTAAGSNFLWHSPTADPKSKNQKSTDQVKFVSSTVIVKREKEELEEINGAMEAKSIRSQSSSIDGKTTDGVKSKGFEFSLQESLNILQPGCKSNESSNSASSKKNVMDFILNSAIQAEYSGISHLSNVDSLQLNQAETLKINQLLEASKCLTVPLCEDSNFNKIYVQDLPDPSLIHVINLTEIAIRRLIKMAKRIPAFKNFCQEDQIALLKAGCTEMMILRSVSAYDPDKEVWKIPQDHESYQNIKVNVLQNASNNIYEEHKRFMLAFEPEWRQDAQIMALLSAISLFSPQRQNVIHYQAIEHEQKSYFFLLKRYLESRYGGCTGKTNYYRLLQIIGDLHVLNMDHVRVFLEANPKEVEPLLIEIFELKNS